MQCKSNAIKTTGVDINLVPMAQWLDHWNFTFTPNTRVRVRDKADFNFTISGGGYIRKLVYYFY